MSLCRGVGDDGFLSAFAQKLLCGPGANVVQVLLNMGVSVRLCIANILDPRICARRHLPRFARFCMPVKFTFVGLPTGSEQSGACKKNIGSLCMRVLRSILLLHPLTSRTMSTRSLPPRRCSLHFERLREAGERSCGTSCCNSSLQRRRWVQKLRQPSIDLVCSKVRIRSFLSGPTVLLQQLLYYKLCMDGHPKYVSNIYSVSVYERSARDPKKTKVSEADACHLLEAFEKEIGNLPGSESLPSFQVISLGSRLAATGHECRLTDHLEKFGLTAPIPVSYVDVGSRAEHPVLSLRDYVTTLDKCGKLVDILLCNHKPKDYKLFWKKFRTQQPLHPLFSLPDDGDLEVISVPLWLHADEGTGQKKRGIMVVQSQPILGHGSTRSLDLNHCKNSLQTRMLYSVMQSRVYSGKLKQKKPLLALIRHLATDLASCFHNPIEIDVEGERMLLRLVPLGLKGDLQAIVKLTSLNRHFGRNTYKQSGGSGICHMCRAGMTGHEWHDLGFANMARMREEAPLPWKQTPDLIAKLPMSPDHLPNFCKYDVFHSIHKGVLGDACASAIVSGPI